MLGHFHIDLGLVQRGIGRDTDEGTFEFADVGRDLTGDELQHVIGHAGALPLSLVAQDRQAGLHVWRLNVGDETPSETATEAVFEGRNRVRHTVGGNHDLLVCAVQ